MLGTSSTQSVDKDRNVAAVLRQSSAHKRINGCAWCPPVAPNRKILINQNTAYLGEPPPPSPLNAQLINFFLHAKHLV
jgi:hypothetical protein